MDGTDTVMHGPHDHIMANTWRLIFERKARQLPSSPLSHPIPDFSELEQLLCEYRLIGLSLAQPGQRQRCS